MTKREIRIEIKRIKEHERWLADRFIEELKKDKREIARLRREMKSDGTGTDGTNEG